MSLHDDFDIEITENEDFELSEKEYSDILGLEGMTGGEFVRKRFKEIRTQCKDEWSYCEGYSVIKILKLQ